MPYQIDIFAIFILLGVVQAIFLTLFFFSKQNRQKSYNVFHGLLMLVIAMCLVEILLMYTGYIIHVLHLVDFSEPAALLIGPFLYLYVCGLLFGKVEKKSVWIHIAFPILYTLMFLPFLLCPIDVKYNAYINAYHPGLPFREVHIDYNPWMFVLTGWHTELVLISLGLYSLLSGRLIFKSIKEKNESFWKPHTLALRTVRNGVLQIVVFSVLIVVVKLFNKNDTGDHLFAAFGGLLVYTTSMSVMSRSGFFSQTPLSEPSKYKSSTLTSEQRDDLIGRLTSLMKEKKPFLKTDFSITELADQLGVSVHILSQSINDGLRKSFFELMAEYRVEEAKRILKESSHLKIEEIAEQVGYNSKSSFNTAFKKFTGKTPSEFRAG